MLSSKNIDLRRVFAAGAYPSLQHLGGFNVSNLMGIKQRMIDIDKKITFYFLQNA
jgi:hypothetical protein